jgi:hypothetical protein
VVALQAADEVAGTVALKTNYIVIRFMSASGSSMNGWANGGTSLAPVADATSEMVTM